MTIWINTKTSDHCVYFQSLIFIWSSIEAYFEKQLDSWLVVNLWRITPWRFQVQPMWKVINSYINKLYIVPNFQEMWNLPVRDSFQFKQANCRQKCQHLLRVTCSLTQKITERTLLRWFQYRENHRKRIRVSKGHLDTANGRTKRMLLVNSIAHLLL